MPAAIPAYVGITYVDKTQPTINAAWCNAIGARAKETASVVAYGAVGDGVTDDAAAFNAAAASLGVNGGILFIPVAPQSWLLNSRVNIPSNVLVLGYGALIKVAASVAFDTAFYTTGSNVVFEGLSFDLGFTRCPTYNAGNYPSILNCAIYAFGATNIKAINCQFSNLYTVAIQFYTSDTLEVQGCTFSSPAQSQQLHLEFIWILTVSGRNVISDCTFTNAGTSPATGVAAVFASGTTGPVIIERCWTNNCSRDNTGSHRLETFAFYGNSVDVRVVDCFSYNNLSAWLRLADTARVRVLNNYATIIATGAQTDTAMINAYGTITYVGVGQVGLQDVQIVGNALINPSVYTGRTAIAVGSQDFSCPSTDIQIESNQFTGFHLNVDVYGPMKDVRVEKNMSVSPNGGQILFEYGSATVTAGNGVSQVQSVFDGIYANDNYSQDTGSSNISGVVLDMTKTPEYTGTLGQVEFNRNRVEATAGSTAQGVQIRGVSPANSLTRAGVRANEVKGYSIGLYLRFAQEMVAEENRLVGNTTPITQSGNTMYVGSGNRFASGAAWSGQVQLSSGTKTVSTGEVVAGDSILLSTVVGSTQGFLNVGTIVAGTSFVIHSSNASDASMVYWEIRH